ncbi:MAG: gliding motility-associated C-terminal domain-containing protein [Bacteroidetes bacterium]|nr:gliding motility-associated C-terminal domain-containing protein [Bacteroidota bacterium]
MNYKFRSYIVLLLICLQVFSINSTGQNKSNRGKEFWLGYSFSSNFFAHAGLGDPVNKQELALYISTTTQTAHVTVSINGTTWSQNLTIPANTADASILIPKSGANDARILSDGASNRAIHILSDVPVAVYAHQYDAMYSAATMLMPSDTWGFTYYSVSYYQTLGNSNPPYMISPTGINFPDWYDWFYVIAKDDNTRIQITPSDTCKNGWLPGQTYTVNLNKGEIYTVFGKANFADGWFSDTVNSSKDLTGSKIVSVAGGDGKCHPVALFSGTGGMHVCQKDGGEAVQQQVFPAQAWGTRYLTHHTISNFSGDINATFRNYYRVCVRDPSTVVKRNGVALTGLIKNFYYQFVDSIGGDYIEADKPILISQYIPNRAQCWQSIQPMQLAIGDPEMFYLSPIEQGQNSVIFYISSLNLISKSYVNIIIPTQGLSSLRVDGSTVPGSQIKTHPNNNAYSVAVFDLSGGMDMQHTIVSDSTFTATVYGLGAYESYGYNVGCNINNLDVKSEIKNVFNTSGVPDTITCPKTPFRIFAKVGYPLTNIRWHFSEVPGLTPTADSIIANPVPTGTSIMNGRTYHVYTVQQDLSFATAGTYKIPISYTAPEIDACNNTITDTLTVLVKPGPVANFSISPQTCLADTVTFTNQSNTTGFNITQYLWNFDDGSTQNTENARKRFSSSGSHDVRYRIYADNGCTGDTTKTVNITNGTGPQLSFTISGKYCVDSAIKLTSSLPADGSMVFWWDFGGNLLTTSANNFAVFTNTTPATNIVVRHSATVAGTCSPDTVQKIIPSINTNPAPAPFSIIGSPACPQASLQFNSAATGITTWRWDFGNGTGNQIPPFTRSYNSSGNYTVKLSVADNNGCGSTETTNSVVITPSPIVNAGPDKIISLGASTILDATITNPDNYNFLWSPPYGLSSTSILNPLATPDVTITYTITATDKLTGCIGKDAVQITPISKLYIPNGFTPNNDGKNDKWEIPGLALYPDALVTVYNRWGEKVFESKNYYGNPWNGLYKGLMIPGSYVYTIKLYPDKPEVIKGTVTIIQ